ncbi:Acyl-CoA dehydrogenase [Streptoalloteichus tenebrarius]|uniref:Acyl-CoA dehydrogenase n=1 Tax=Streptoalloteichus tenebrarius (strain ATCC 17920 / DSM 40477 / JCM 4838 / CBS 697.72 / NBRC 16177 / NCIMB 11028 / NRRL B-12390 / A12253. 1 / ISP 5477) TaxID=1933 RepID=A0ABT1I1Q4_STRSD|nr:acyl-CoA dehydrogenase family protein [Streptoalloteichus tenebrarius]MCP2261719.1 Acyl-CoA dehydrogenase [Streptoalloteichus tenebrarius]
MGAPVIDRQLPTDDAAALLDLTRDLATRELAPRAAEAERTGEFPRELFRTLGRAGLLGLPYPEEYGGSGQPYEVYLQVVEELARAWLAVGLGVSVHTLSCHGLASFGTEEQKRRWLPDMLGGELLGAYCLSEPHCGSDAAALRTRAERQPDGDYLVTGTKAWITHGGVADFCTLLARTGGEGAKGISAFLVEAGTPGMVAAPAERKMGMKSSVTAQVVFDRARVAEQRRIGAEGEGFGVAMAALDAGRLGIAACAVGLAQAALDVAVEYAGERTAFGRPIGDFQGVSFLLADAAAGVEASRQLYLAAARRKDAGRPYATQAAMAKLVATDTCMKVTTDMVQVLGGAGYVEDYPVERYMREAKVLQIVEGTNQIQRLVIGRALLDR